MKKIFLLAATLVCFINLINAQAGQPDPSFGTNGMVKTDLGDSYTPGKPGVNQIFSLPDRSMYVLEGGISKRRANGSIDSSFGTNGFVANDIVPHQMAIEPDGKIVAAYNGGLVRYNTDGSLDSSFSINVDSANNYFRALAIGKDGKIIWVGFDGTLGYYYISRYNTNGSPDTTFSSDGKVNIDLNSGSNSIYINTAVIQSNGKIVVAGERRVGFDDHLAFAVLRYNTNGSLDSSFSGDGIQTTEFGRDNAYLYAAAIQSDGKILVAGATGAPHLSLARYNTDGSPDKSFSSDGKLITDYSTSYGGQSIAFQHDGKIVVSSDRTLIRFNTDGSTAGTVFKNGNFHINSIALQSDGKILAGGSTGADGSYGSYFALARYTTDGNFDKTFIGNGLLTDVARAENTGYKKTAVQKDGKVVTAGSYWNGKNFDFAIARYNTDGSADNTFSGDGIQTTDFNSDNNNAIALTIQNDGKIVVAGVNALARYNADGSLDKTFSGDGKLITNIIDITSIAVQNDGKIVVAGGHKYRNSFGFDVNSPAVARYNPDGSVDRTFGAEGKQIGPFDSFFNVFDGSASSIVIQNDQKIVIAASLSYTFYSDRGEEERFDSIVLVRFNINGSFDTTYNHTGKKIFTGGNTAIYGYAGSGVITKQDDDKIVIAGTVWRNLFSGRVNTDGSTDSSFKGINYDIYNGDTAYLVSAIALEDNAKIVVMVNNDTLYRFTADGRFDSTFNSTGRQSPPFKVHDIVIANNKLYIAGGDRYGIVARYLLDGTNTAPTVTLNSPADNATYLAPAL